MDSSDSELEAFIHASLHKRSPIHNYFTYKKETNKSVCKKCRAEINGKNSTNLTNHLKIPLHIKSEYEKYLEELSDYKELFFHFLCQLPSQSRVFLLSFFPVVSFEQSYVLHYTLYSHNQDGFLYA